MSRGSRPRPPRAVKAEEAASSACAVPANEVVLTDAEIRRAELHNRGGRPAVPLVGAQLDPFRAVAEDHPEEEALNPPVSPRPPPARVELGPADLHACRIARVEDDRGHADDATGLTDGERNPAAVCQPRSHAPVKGGGIGRNGAGDVLPRAPIR